MKELFTPFSLYKKRARLIAILWTLLVFTVCLMPAKDIPEINVPLIDKWVHFLLFGAFAFFCLCSRPSKSFLFLFLIFVFSVFYGWLIETLQGAFPFLGRTYELMDIVADGIGGFIGITVFYFLFRYFEKRNVKS